MSRTKITPPDESHFVERLQAGEAAAYDELVSLYSSRLIAHARRILGGDEDLARDAVQDGFLSAHRAMDRFNGEARLSSWLHRIVTNAALARLRVKRRRPECFITEEFGIGADEDPLDRATARLTNKPFESADELLVEQQDSRFLHESIASLKENHRRVLMLRYIHEFDTGETARILGIRPNTVKTRLMRARDALRAQLQREAASPAFAMRASTRSEHSQSQAA